MLTQDEIDKMAAQLEQNAKLGPENWKRGGLLDPNKWDAFVSWQPQPFIGPDGRELARTIIIYKRQDS